MSELKLAAEFPASSRADWMKRVEAVLKGASFEERLVRTHADGIRLEPLYGQQQAHRAARARAIALDAVPAGGPPGRRTRQ